jgi:hypothetical protein
VSGLLRDSRSDRVFVYSASVSWRSNRGLGDSGIGELLAPVEGVVDGVPLDEVAPAAVDAGVVAPPEAGAVASGGLLPSPPIDPVHAIAAAATRGAIEAVNRRVVQAAWSIGHPAVVSFDQMSGRRCHARSSNRPLANGGGPRAGSRVSACARIVSGDRSAARV